MQERSAGYIPPEEHKGTFDSSIHEVELDPNIARTVLAEHSAERATGSEVKLTEDEVRTVVVGWERLEPEIQDLVLIGFPEIAAALLHDKLAKKEKS